jgi:hypothetical protein
MAGSRFVEITLEDMEAFLKRAYRALHPKKEIYKGQVVFHLSLSDNHQIFIRVYSSIFRDGIVRKKGSDSIRVVMLTDKNKALMPPSKLVMRTTNWRNALQERIEDLLEIYESKVGYWKERRLNTGGGGSDREDALDEAVKESLPDLTPREHHEIEDAEEAEIREERENSREEPARVPSVPAPKMPGLKKTKPTPAFEGVYRALPGGAWGLQIAGPGEPGDEGMAVSKGNQRKRVRLLELKQKTRAYKSDAEVELWTFEDLSGKPRQQYGRFAADPLVESVAARYLNG